MDGLRTFVTDTVTDIGAVDSTDEVDPSDVLVKNARVDVTIEFGRRGGIAIDFGTFVVWNCVNGNFSVSKKECPWFLSPYGNWSRDPVGLAQFKDIGDAYWHAVHAGAVCFECLGVGKFTTYHRSGSEIPNVTAIRTCSSCGGRGAPGAKPRAAWLSTLDPQLSTFQATA